MNESKTRYNKETLMRGIHEAMVAAGHYDEFEPIIDYFLPDDYGSRVDFTSYEFDVVAMIAFGASEGIYLDVYANGVTDATGKHNHWHLGTYKTLNKDLEAMQTMGKLAGTIGYYGASFVNQHLDDFEPEREGSL